MVVVAMALGAVAACVGYLAAWRLHTSAAGMIAVVLGLEYAAAAVLAPDDGLAARLMIDCSHANSSKQHQKQIEVTHDVAHQVAAGDQRIFGLMIESHLKEGRQDLKTGQPLAYGVSITDACIGLDQTIPLLQVLADAVRARRMVSGV